MNQRQPAELDLLGYAWEKAKQEESEANDRRRKIEEDIIRITGCKLEGTETTKTDYYKICVEGKLTRKLDTEAWLSIADRIPEELNPVETKLDLSITRLRALEKSDSVSYELALTAISTKPAKPYVKIERVTK